MIPPFNKAPAHIALLAGMLLPAAALAQTGQAMAAPSSQLELQTSDAGGRLAKAMSTLANEPRNLDALLTAGEAALKLEDPRSAIGFFGRADDVSPNNGRVKAGLGRSMLALGQIVDGLRLMDQAFSFGYSDAALLADRGLARDLTGNQTGAQQDYLAAMKLDPDNDRLVRRYAVSLGISGQVDQAEKVIEPLLHKNDRAAWRDRAFILAMNGRTQDALGITSRVMPKALADAIEPYIVRMAMLTPGQRAAAVHLGQFPQGLVNVRVASTAVPVRPSAPVAVADSTGKGRKKKEKVEARTEPGRKAAAPVAPTAAPMTSPAPLPPAAPAAPTTSAAGLASAAGPASAAPARAEPSPPLRPVPVPAARAISRQVESPADSEITENKRNLGSDRFKQNRSESSKPEPARVAAAAPAEPAARRPVQGPPVPPAVMSSAPPARPAPAPASSAAPPGESTRSLADIIADIEIPASERRNDVVPVNLAEIAAIQAAERKAREAEEAKARREEAKRKAEAEAKAKAEAEKKRLAANPARYWVQIGVGRDTDALAFTLRRMKKDHDTLASQDGWWADYGRTKRLVVGPFPNLGRAKAVEADMKKAGSDALVWRSEAGEEVHRIGGK